LDDIGRKQSSLLIYKYINPILTLIEKNVGMSYNLCNYLSQFKRAKAGKESKEQEARRQDKNTSAWVPLGE
jgi:hypothetical protein